MKTYIVLKSDEMLEEYRWVLVSFSDFYDHPKRFIYLHNRGYERWSILFLIKTQIRHRGIHLHFHKNTLYPKWRKGEYKSRLVSVVNIFIVNNMK